MLHPLQRHGDGFGGILLCATRDDTGGDVTYPILWREIEDSGYKCVDIGMRLAFVTPCHLSIRPPERIPGL